MYENRSYRKQNEGNKRKHLLTVYSYSEENISVLLYVSEKAACKSRGGKSAYSAYAVFYCGCFYKILAVYVAVGYVEEILIRTRHAYVVEYRVKYKEKCAFRRGENVYGKAQSGYDDRQLYS